MWIKPHTWFVEIHDPQQGWKSPLHSPKLLDVAAFFNCFLLHPLSLTFFLFSFLLYFSYPLPLLFFFFLSNTKHLEFLYFSPITNPLSFYFYLAHLVSWFQTIWFWLIGFRQYDSWLTFKEFIFHRSNKGRDCNPNLWQWAI